MKLPTLTAITLASAVLAAGPAFAAGTPNAAAPLIPPPGPAAQPAGGAVATPVPGTTPAPSADATAQNGGSNANAQANRALNEKGTLPASGNMAAAQSGSTAATVPPPATATSPKMTETTAAPAAGANASGAPASGAAGSAISDNATAEPIAGGMDHNATAPGGIVLTNNPPGSANVVPLTNGNNNNDNAKNQRTPNQRNPVLANDGLPLAGKVIGSAVFNASDKKVGTVNDILMGAQRQPDQVVLNLNEGNKRVLVPFREFVFGNTQISGHDRVILPNQTPISLAKLPPFQYHLNSGNNMTAHNGGVAGMGIGGPLPAVGTPGAVPVVHPPVTTAMKTTGSAVTPVTPVSPDTQAVAPAGTVANAPVGTATVMNTKNNNNNNDANAALPHQRNPVLADNGLPRASHVIGSAVYNIHDQKLGTVNQILMGEKGEPDQAVISVNDGNNHHVLVPFRQLVFGNTKINDNNRVILPDATVAQLGQLPPFVYDGNGSGNGNG